MAADSGLEPTGVARQAYGRRQVVTDVGVVVAAAFFDAGVASNSTGSDLDPLGFIIWGLALGALMWRRSHPIAVLLITAAAAIAFMVVGYRAINVFPFIVALYGVVLYGRPRRRARVAAMAAGLAVLTVFAFAEVARDTFEAAQLVSNVLLLGAVVVLGETIRTRQVLAQAEVERAQRQVDVERQRARDAVAAERLQIARELHDIVAHSVTVMTVQMGGARLTVGDDPERAREALDEAERAGRRAMRELRRMLTVLRGATSRRRRPPGSPGPDWRRWWRRWVVPASMERSAMPAPPDRSLRRSTRPCSEWSRRR